MKRSVGPKTLIFPTPVWCVGTYDEKGAPNVMTIAWGGICCSKPPCVAISIRKATYTYGNLLARKCFTLSVPGENYVKEADYFGIASGRDVNKFEATGLTPLRAEKVDAPFVAEFPMVLECSLVHHHELGLHTYFVGEILDVKLEESCFDAEGKPALDLVKPILYAPDATAYHSTGPSIGKGFSIGRR